MKKILKVEYIDDPLDKKIIFHGKNWKKEFREYECIHDINKDYEIRKMMFTFLLDNAIRFKDKYWETELYKRMTKSFYLDCNDKVKLLDLLHDAIVKEDELAIYFLKCLFISKFK